MYKSTRNSNIDINASLAIIKGIADDGGLFVTDDIKKVSLKEIKDFDFYQLAIYILERYLNDFSKEKIKEIVYKAYKDKFDIEEIVHVNKLKDVNFLELYHGPTKAFKDIALSILPLLLEESKKINKITEKTIILTATSGDTGSAALSGFKDQDIIVFYPTVGVSKIQEKQMLSFVSSKAHVIAIEGNFDDAQNLVKRAFNDQKLKKYNLSSANSINIGRLIPQIIYYFYGYFDLIKEEKIELFEKINIVVPTGNFGNIMAAFLAMRMGLPVNKLICASNSNKVLTDFFKEKKYDRNRELIKTISPSMDILISSNLERLLYYICKDSNVVSQLMISLNQQGNYELDNKFINKEIEMFYSNYATEEETKKVIKELFTNESYLIDTHTAVGYSVYKKYLHDTNDKHCTLIASTANPYKFTKSIASALDINSELDDYDLMEKINKVTSFPIPEELKNIFKEYKKNIWSLDEAYNKLIILLGEIYEEDNKSSSNNS